MRSLPVPTSFNLHGMTIQVRYDKNLIRNDDNTGEARYRSGEIVLCDPSTMWCTPEQFEQVFYHELVHMILHQMHNKLHEDEDFVDLFASLLHQALQTMTFEPITKSITKSITKRPKPS